MNIIKRSRKVMLPLQVADILYIKESRFDSDNMYYRETTLQKPFKFDTYENFIN